eukprot:IDg18495t1
MQMLVHRQQRATTVYTTMQGIRCAKRAQLRDNSPNIFCMYKRRPDSNDADVPQQRVLTYLYNERARAALKQNNLSQEEF